MKGDAMEKFRKGILYVTVAALSLAAAPSPALAGDDPASEGYVLGAVRAEGDWLPGGSSVGKPSAEGYVLLGVRLGAGLGGSASGEGYDLRLVPRLRVFPGPPPIADTGSGRTGPVPD